MGQLVLRALMLTLLVMACWEPRIAVAQAAATPITPAEYGGAMRQLAARIAEGSEREARLSAQLGQAEAQRDAALERIAALEQEIKALRGKP